MQEGATVSERQVHKCATESDNLSGLSNHIWTTAISTQSFRKPLGQALQQDEEWTSLLCEHAQHVGMGTRKHRSSVVISQRMATTYRMQRNFLSGPWMQHISFFYAFLDPEGLQLLFQNCQRNPLIK